MGKGFENDGNGAVAAVQLLHEFGAAFHVLDLEGFGQIPTSRIMAVWCDPGCGGPKAPQVPRSDSGTVLSVSVFDWVVDLLRSEFMHRPLASDCRPAVGVPVQEPDSLSAGASKLLHAVIRRTLRRP